jgi:hypothetical protein
MTARTLFLRAGLPVLVIAAITALIVPLRSADDVPRWIPQDANWPTGKAMLQAFGDRFATSEELYAALKEAADGGTPLKWSQLNLPAWDWSGVYTRTKGGLQFDPDLGRGERSSARLTPGGQQALDTKAEHLARTGGEYDPISDCRPPGTPRWLTEPFLHEYVVTAGQTWLINEMVNDIRRVYTDRRAHTPDDESYATWNGDTIGFWNGEMLITHTKDLMSGQYQRGVQPNYSEQTTLVERWRKVDSKTLQADVWVFDPVNLAHPWYTRQSWTKLTNDDSSLRLRYWDCRENPNNEIITTDQGTSQFKDFDFVPDDAAISADPSVKQQRSGAAR